MMLVMWCYISMIPIKRVLYAAFDSNMLLTGIKNCYYDTVACLSLLFVNIVIYCVCILLVGAFVCSANTGHMIFWVVKWHLIIKILLLMGYNSFVCDYVVNLANPVFGCIAIYATSLVL